jgi:hypothetical protein
MAQPPLKLSPACGSRSTLNNHHQIFVCFPRPVICFEWLQRPENVLAGHIRWSDYRGRDASTTIRIFHHKTGAIVLHPWQDSDGTLFYADAEDVLAKVPRRGIPIILHETRDKTEPGKPKPAKLYSESGMAKLVRRLRDQAGLPATFTLDACRHGGMTELENAELTDRQGRALSAHKGRAYEGYAKRTMDRALAATRTTCASHSGLSERPGNRISE